ncbi:MAG: hypothetical protein IVW52_19440 [Acidimicrobiales bacterium]|nr:hypothetical protein [Acidimicrobiales bacterium]
MTSTHDVHPHGSTDGPHAGHGGHGGHGWMMIACCIPMLIIAVVLVATGVVNLDHSSDLQLTAG